jgi:chromosomal replication initiation ATPase DnaA
MYSFAIKQKIDKKNDKIIAQIIPDSKKEPIKYVCLIESEYKKQSTNIEFNPEDYSDLLKKYDDPDEKKEILVLLENKFYKHAGIQKSEKTIENLTLDDAKFKIMPVFGKFQVYYLYGASGSGKSYIARDIAEGYHFLNPKNGVFLISKLNEDDTLDKAKFIKRVNPESFKEEKPDVTEFIDSLVIIDDYEGWESSDKLLYNIIISLINDIASMGRHHRINLIVCNHNHTNYRATRLLLNEATGIIIYPQSSGDNALKYLLTSYVGLTKAQINEIKKARSRWVFVHKHAPRYMMTTDEIKLL